MPEPLKKAPVTTCQASCLVSPRWWTPSILYCLTLNHAWSGLQQSTQPNSDFPTWILIIKKNLYKTITMDRSLDEILAARDDVRLFPSCFCGTTSPPRGNLLTWIRNNSERAADLAAVVVTEANGGENPAKTSLVMASERYASAIPMHMEDLQPDLNHERLLGALPPPPSLNCACPPVQHLLFGLRLPL